ncbi:chromatin accessibility complex protein 1-like isoform X2 [Lycorma delicatula]|uniref:chromatin accessibility complex protein 1-like isoform X2 n=1 Tax=Lycorma delicatula TaxID=130591 RepID=UPI003F50E32E
MATSEIPDVKTKDTQLPLSRTKIIMKSSPGVENVTKDSVYLTAKATELFVKYLAKEVIKNNSSRKKIEYKDVAEFVQSSRKLSFLHECIPQKITFREAQARRQRAQTERAANRVEWEDSQEAIAEYFQRWSVPRN